MNRPRTYYVDLHLRPEQLERFYQGAVNAVWARDVQGVRLQFPLQSLRPFVTRDGIRGRFELRVGSDNRLVGCQRCDT